MLKLEYQDIMNLEKYFRISLINKISGIKSANLIGTASQTGQLNLAIFNSVFHVGSKPPYLGFMMRPLSIDRHTYSNIKETGFFTINQVGAAFHQKAHQTSAKYGGDVSEFESCELTPEYIDEFPVPFVAESQIKIGLSFQEEHLIAVNDTIIMIGQIEKLIIPRKHVSSDGDIDFEKLNLVGIGGLDTYYTCRRLDRYAYARPNEETKVID